MQRHASSEEEQEQDQQLRGTVHSRSPGNKFPNHPVRQESSPGYNDPAINGVKLGLDRVCTACNQGAVKEKAGHRFSFTRRSGIYSARMMQGKEQA